MADDIDIEEHDVLEHPALKRIFPDISVIKEEIKCFYGESSLSSDGLHPSLSERNVNPVNDDEVSSVKEEAEVATDCSQDPTIDSTTKLPCEIAISDSSPKDVVPKDEGDVQLFEDTTTLPCAKTRTGDNFTAPTIENVIEVRSDEEDLQQKESYTGNKIILGTKPNKTPTIQVDYEKFYEQKINPYDAKVLVDDLNSYLINSDRYCPECLILFGCKNSFEIHKKISHGFECESSESDSESTPVEKEKSVKSAVKRIPFGDLRHGHSAPYQTYLNAVNKVKKANGANQVCPHCEKSFLSRQSLIEHLYSVLITQTEAYKNGKYAETETGLNTKAVSNPPHHHNQYTEIVETEAKCNSDSTTKTKSISNLTKKSKAVSIPQQHKQRTKLIKTKTKSMNAKSKAKEDVKSLRFSKAVVVCQRIKWTKLIETETKSISRIRTKSKALTVHQNHAQRAEPIDTTTKSVNEENSSILDGAATDSIYYKCLLCTYYFLENVQYLNHMKNNHRMHTTAENAQHTYFDPKCSLCSNIFPTCKMYNDHITQSHKEYRMKQLYVLKSSLFKCSRCDIHFLTVKTAVNHAEHMELLINWKCSVCLRIFKDVDKTIHQRQHEATTEFTVYDLNASDIPIILYNCAKCAIHFMEDTFFTHYQICESQLPTNASYCSICDILIDSMSIAHHTNIHDQNSDSSVFKIIDAEYLPILNQYSSKRKNDERNTYEVVSATKKTRSNEADDYTLFYCNNCACFLNENLFYHSSSRCQKRNANVCKVCGLKLTSETYLKHKNLHLKHEDLKLQDFVFRDIISNNLIRPPIPQYSKCSQCEVTFLTSVSSFTHICNNVEYLTCHMCDDKLSEQLFKLHMSFHYYSISQTSNSPLGLAVSPMSADSDQHVRSDSSKSSSSAFTQPKKSVEQGISKTKNNVEDHTLKRHLNAPVALQLNLDKNEMKSHIKTKKMLNIDQSLLIPELVEAKSKIVNGSAQELPHVIYSCKDCGLSLDSYDKVIEHCQYHYDEQESDAILLRCHTCNLNFDVASIENHRKLHDQPEFSLSKCIVLNFDIFYFVAENDIWVKHVFKPLTQNVMKQIINRSIYRYECRIKMTVTQQGPPELTVYKCGKCNCFVDRLTVYNHAENACFKLRKHPCSLCGLPFISAVTKLEHEKIHDNAIIQSKSYRIVTFNREEDKKFNNSMYSHRFYTLYQCRNCDCVVDKSKTKIHVCGGDQLKCSECGLLINNRDYSTHTLRHLELPNFIQKNMKVILFGEKLESNGRNKSKQLLPSYDGIICDYSFLKCVRCNICLEITQCTSKHSCSFGASRLRCSDCHLDFLASRFKAHRKLHETEPDYVRENMRIVPFDCLQLGKSIENNTANKTVNNYDEMSEYNRCQQNQTSRIIINSCKNATSDVVQKTATLFKCACGLHFLEEFDLISHTAVCNPKQRIAKRRCSKCGLMFTPSVLFNHLIVHHGNKKYSYTFKVIDRTKIDINIVIYRCSKCRVHFIQANKASEHLSECYESRATGINCTSCKLMFNNASCLKAHTENHHRGNNVQYMIFELKEGIVALTKVDR